MKKKKLIDSKIDLCINETNKFPQNCLLFFEMGMIFVACISCLLIQISSLPLTLKLSAFALFVFVIKILVKHLTRLK